MLAVSAGRLFHTTGNRQTDQNSVTVVESAENEGAD